MDRKHASLGCLVASLALVAGACTGAGAGSGSAPPTATAGAVVASDALGKEPPVSLRLAVVGGADGPARLAVDDLVQQVAALSGGRMTVVPTFEQAPDVVARGDAELGIVPARDWDVRGETSLQALQAPMLVDNDALARAIAEGQVGRDALGALTTVVGLALWPEDVRHPAAFSSCGKDFRDPSRVAGTAFFVTPSAVSQRVIEALGATVYDEQGRDRNVDAPACVYQGHEVGFLRVGVPMQASPVVVADVALWTKFMTLVANPAAFGRLSAAQQSVLRAAAEAVQAGALERQPLETDTAPSFCTEGGSIVLAGADGLAAWRTATQAVYAALEQDAVTKRLIAQIRDLKTKTPASPGASACDGSPQPTPVPVAAIDTTGYVGTAFPDGTFRRELLAEDLIAAGLDPVIAQRNEQVLTYVFDNGTVTFRWEAGGTSGGCQGTYESVDGTFVRMVTTGGDPDCGVGPDSVWREEPDGISFVTLDPSFLPSDHILLDHWVWTRIR